jgi:aspartate-semialdehyde dehydrogenase
MKIAVIGATGAVGREIIKDLDESSLKEIEVFPFASPRSEGETLFFRGKSIVVKAFSLSEVRKCDYALMSAGGAFSREHAVQISENGGPPVIDNSSAWRMKKETPLVIPEVNGEVLKGFKSGIIANPNCAMIQLAICLKPLSDAFGIEFVQVTTLQSVSGTGNKGIKELSNQIEAHMKFAESPPLIYDHPIAFNVIPYIGPIEESGYCEEELKVIEELRKVLQKPELPVMPTTVRVPVFNCHSESVTVQLSKSASLEEIRKVIRNAKTPVYYSDEQKMDFPTSRTASGHRDVFISRLRFLNGAKSGKWLQFWNLADNLKKGAATNAVQILECLVEQGASH